MLITRIATGVVLGMIVVIGTLALPTWYAGIVIGVLWVVGALEWADLSGMRGSAQPLFTGSVVVLMLAFGWLGFDSSPTVGVIWLALVAMALAIAGLVRYPQPSSPGVLTVEGYCSLLPSWLAFCFLHTIQPILALTALGIVWGADVGAYVVGRAFGRRRLAPAISPGKTWAGVVGGIAAAMLVGLAGAFYVGLGLAGPILAAAGAAASILGDLAVSMMKRAAGRKDSGRLLPGHGGALDRIDGVTIGLPLFTIGLQLSGALD